MIVKDLSPELRADAASYIIHIEVRRNLVFRDLPNSALGSLIDVLKNASAKRGENIVTKGDPGIAMYIIVEGVARFSHGHQWVPFESIRTQGDTKGKRDHHEFLKSVKKL